MLRLAGPIDCLIADKAYDTNKLRELLAGQGIEAVIPSVARRKPMIPYNAAVYRQRNLIERMFGRLKDFRRIATRYDKLARNFLEAGQELPRQHRPCCHRNLVDLIESEP